MDVTDRCQHLIDSYGQAAVLVIEENDAKAAGLSGLAANRKSHDLPFRLVTVEIPASAALKRLRQP